MNKKILLFASGLGAILVERYAKTSEYKFLGGVLTGLIANLLAWKVSIPKKPLMISGVLAGVGAVQFNGMMKWMKTTPKTASAAGVFLGSSLYSLVYNYTH